MQHLDYLDGRRLKYFALTTSLAEIWKGFAQLICEKDLQDQEMRNMSRYLKTNLTDTDISIDDIYDAQIWLKLHRLQVIAFRDLVPYNLWVPLVASRLRGHMSGLANVANRYHWNWVQFCIVVSHIRSSSGVAIRSRGEIVPEWKAALTGPETPLELISRINSVLLALPKQFGRPLLDLF